jgi:ribosomal protein S18 acetylase RimI-like enzyme
MTATDLIIRPAAAADADDIWRVLEPTFRAGETYPVPRDIDRSQALSYWFGPANEVWVAEDNGRIVGTYYLRANQGGPGGHVANCGYVAHPSASGRGLGEAMCRHSIARAAERGFRAMQFNLVISTNARALRVWQRCGFDIVGRLPGAFLHPLHGYVEALVMYRTLLSDSNQH